MAELSPPFLRRLRRKGKGGESQQGRQKEGLSVEFRAREERELEDEALSLGLASSPFGNRDCSRPSPPPRPHFLLIGPPVSLRSLLSSLPWARAHTHSLPSWGLFTWRGKVQDTVEGASSASLSLGARGYSMGAVLFLLSVRGSSSDGLLFTGANEEWLGRGSPLVQVYKAPRDTCCPGRET